MAVRPYPSHQEIANPAAAGRTVHDDGDEHAGAAHTSVLVAVAVSGSATRRAAARPVR